ncbi:shikimate kinase [Paenibacillus barengoltzii]|jgi:shikimate kinase|uniref:shikimate kinase n=2 Tax=Paenibacillus barengoltzii TaxID=343517 RepID=UPI000A085BE1|nr:shikimate kinase [Paenibacillus barengoltzii]SMF57241.1 shikimate kinase [Paenibacillus barengoltzii]
MLHHNIVLIGMMGTGKSTVGSLLAAATGKTFVDLDQRIVREAGRSIPDIFAAEGEAYFRDLESAALRNTLQEQGIVLATGGGAVLREANRLAMRGGGLVVALQATADEILARVGEDPNRPLLAGGAKERITALLEERKELYAFAHLTVDTSGKSAEQVAAEILTHYRGS